MHERQAITTNVRFCAKSDKKKAGTKSSTLTPSSYILCLPRSHCSATHKVVLLIVRNIMLNSVKHRTHTHTPASRFDALIKVTTPHSTRTTYAHRTHTSQYSYHTQAFFAVVSNLLWLPYFTPNPHPNTKHFRNALCAEARRLWVCVCVRGCIRFVQCPGVGGESKHRQTTEPTRWQHERKVLVFLFFVSALLSCAFTRLRKTKLLLERLCPQPVHRIYWNWFERKEKNLIYSAKKPM